MLIDVVMVDTDVHTHEPAGGEARLHGRALQGSGLLKLGLEQNKHIEGKIPKYYRTNIIITLKKDPYVF